MDGYDYDPSQPKWPLRRIIKYVIYTISVLVYLILFIRFFGACDAGFSEKILLDESAAKILEETGSLGARRIDLETNENDEGRIQTVYVVYLEDTLDFQVTLKCNSRYYPISGKEAEYRFVLRRLSGEEISFVSADYIDSTKRLGYDYARLSFSGISYEKDDSLALLIYRAKEWDEISDKDYSSLQPLASIKVYANDCYSKSITPSKSDLEYIE